MTKLVWNGVDTYDLVENIKNKKDYNWDDSTQTLFHKNHQYSAFDVVPATESDIDRFIHSDEDVQSIFGIPSKSGWKYFKLP